MFPIRKNPGSALLIVLAMTALASAAVLAFFTMAGTERTAANFQKNSEAARNLANNAVQVVMGKITEATSGGTAASPLAWASQPGMIRTYNTAGNPAQFHKLYSASNMTTTSYNLTDDLPPADWKSSPGVWVDLNAPVADSTGTQNYPILDPTALSISTNVQPTGFAITNPPGYSGGNSTADNNQAPMPVKWLYQLQDGTLVAGSGSGNTTTVSGATAANPIVCRIAFWADDETCKVNINTAAEGTYWDTPRFDSSTVKTVAAAPAFADFAYAAFQPALYEFQRYPGHPAQVALSSVFPNLTSQNATSLTPRLVWGGSQGGTVWAGNTTSTPQIALQNAPRKAPYATVDEYQFSGNYSASGNRAENVLHAASINKSDLEAAKFFITANSRTPEVNLFNLPRIACWPIDKSLSTNATSPRTTAFDRLIAFCSSTLNGTTRIPYYFQRFDAQSPTNDYSNILRNQQLYAYLQRLTDASVPGFGGNFRAKYGNDRDQILTEIFDYIRCTNLSDPNLGGLPPSGTWGKSVNQFANYQNMPITGEVFCGQVMPIRIGNTMGFGRYYTLKDASLIFICTADGKDGVATGNATDTIYQQSNNISINATATYPGKNRTLFPGGNLTANGTTLATTEKRFQIGLFLNYFLPSPAQLKCGPDMLVTVDGLQNIEIAGATNIDGGGTIFPAVNGGWPTAAGLVGRLIATGYSGYNPLHAYLPPRIPFTQHRSPIYVREGGNGTTDVAGATSSRIFIRL